MAETNTRPTDARRRNLMALGALALLTVVLAILALMHQAREVAPHYKPQTFLPHLAAEVRDIAQIRIVSKHGMVDAVFKPEKGWVLANRDNYKVSFEQLRQTIVGLAALETIEPKTARADWLHYVDLDAPPKGAGVAITLFDGRGGVLASIVTGKNEDIGDPSGAVGLFVRRAGSNQTWLTRSVFQPQDDPSEWLDKDVVNIDLSRIQEADVDPAGSPSFEVRREKATDAGFNLTNMPKGRQIAYSGAADGVAGAISGFTFDDVRPARAFDFSDPARVARLVTKTFDGLTVTLQTTRQGADYWATISAEGAPGKPLAQKEAREIDARSAGWAYRLPGDKGQLLMTTLESLLKPLTPPASPAQTPPAR